MRAHRDPRAHRGQQRPTEATEPHRGPAETQQKPSRGPQWPTESQQRPQVCNLYVFMCFHAYAIYTCSHAQKSHFTCFCVYLRSRAGCQKSRYAVYTCFYVFQGSLCVVYTCFCVFLDPPSPPLSPPEAQRKPNGDPERSTEPPRAPPEAPQSSPDSPQRPNGGPQTPKRPTVANIVPARPPGYAIYTGFHVFSPVYSRYPWGLPRLSLHVFLRVFLRPVCNLHGFLRYFGPGSGRPRTCPDMPGHVRTAPDISGRPRKAPENLPKCLEPY